MDGNRLFLHTLDDLKSRLRPGVPEYEVMRIAGLLRKLLLDENRLVDMVNRTRRIKVEFLINDAPAIWQLFPDERPLFWSIQDGLDPATSLSITQPRALKRDAFLAKVVMIFRKREITVRDVTAQVANVAGDIHLGAPNNETQATLRNLEDRVSVGGYPADVRSLQAIGRVVLRALGPLRAEVRQSAA